MAIETVSPQEYEAFRTFLKDACGIVLGENKHYLVVSRLRHLEQEVGAATLSELLDQMRKDRSGALRAKVVDAMTTNETYWFRDVQPFAMLQEMILPELLERKPKRLRIWSAACSSGQEPYSISMSLAEFFAGRGRAGVPEIEIVATDISPTMLRLSKQGSYDELALSRGLSPERKQRFFVPDGRSWRVKDELRTPIKFVELNLMKPFTSLGKFDVIFCRNVLIYFAQELKVDILSRMTECLEPSGYLFLGGAESMANYSNAFETVRYSGGLAFRRKAKL